MSSFYFSYHGNHSGEFCDHADPNYRLEDIVLARIEKGFTNFAITEHQCRTREYFYPEEIDKATNDNYLIMKFDDYMTEAFNLKEKYKDQIGILVGFETEVCDDSAFDLINDLKIRYKVDLLVGSVHHIDGIPFDFDKKAYGQAIGKFDGVENMYLRYYDIQFDLINKCRPSIIGHMDLIKKFDQQSFRSEAVMKKIARNIEAAIGLGLVFEFNLRTKTGNLTDAYPSKEILKLISEVGGEITIGDDSHGVDDIGYDIDAVKKYLGQYFGKLVFFESQNGKIKKKYFKI